MGRTGGVDVQALNHYILNEVIKKPQESNEVIKARKLKKQQHFLSLVKEIWSTSNGQASIIIDGDCFQEFIVRIKPTDGPFAGGSFDFEFNIPLKYPKASPTIVCMSDIYHPNIDDDGEICLSLLDEWNPDTNDLLDCVQGLLFLLKNPNLDDPLNPNFTPGEYTMEEFCHAVNSQLDMNDIKQ